MKSIRRALLIGCSNYIPGFELNTPRNDINLLADTLSQRDFHCTKLLDPGYEEISTSVNAFANESAEAELALIFFAGHAYEHAGVGTLLPTDFPFPATGSLLHYAGYPVSGLEKAFTGIKGAGILIIDACRLTLDTPEEVRRWTEEEIRREDKGTTSNLLVAWSTSAGMPAWDGTRNNSEYAKRLATLALQHDLDLEELFKSIGNEIEALSHRQRSWYRSSLNARHSFSDVKKLQFVESMLTPLPPRRGPLSLSRDQSRSKVLLFGNSGTAYETSIRQWPSIRRIYSGSKEITAADWLPSGVAAGNRDLQLELTIGNQPAIFLKREPHVVRTSPDGNSILLLATNRLTLIRSDGAKYKIAKDWRLKWSPYGGTFEDDGCAWVVGGHGQVARIEIEARNLTMLTEMDAASPLLYDIKVTKDKNLAIVGSGGAVMLIRPELGNPIKLSQATTLGANSGTFSLRGPIILFRSQFGSDDLLFCDTAPDDRLLAAGSERGDVHVIDIRSGAIAQHISPDNRTDSLQGLAFLSDGSLITLGHDAMARVAR